MTNVVPFSEADFDANAPRINFTAENTSVKISAGLANFLNQTGTTVSVTVWYQNGSAGQSNAVLPPGGSWSIHVQAGDTYSWVRGGNGVPVNTPRSWINYGNNYLR
ncbi:hypothetical protein [Acidovorax sp.]|uniref:hypothetical protein n=1 Tax=Acidovorax sp. TaxID=1872122 RepID=UPI002ACE374C|nr:hypothetical protein [Acidovorax sp.]MDZ7862446.1 hypothetical protein [Acidovorax sp.]